jgi:multiple sugar transport system permease protein
MTCSRRRIRFLGAPVDPPNGRTTGGGAVYRGERVVSLLMLAPAVVVLLALVIGPILFVIGTSLHRYNLFQVAKPRFVGLENFQYLFNSETFHTSLLRSAVFTATALGVEFVLGFVMAAWVFGLRHLPGMSLVRTALTAPILVAPVVAAIMWRYMYQPDFGIINYLLSLLGLPRVEWLASPVIAIFAIAAVDIWQWTPFVFLIILSGIYGIPANIYEAAELDGTTRWRTTVFITIPLLKRLLIIVLLLRFIDLMRAFEIIIATTQGGPGDASYTLPVLIWETAFVNFEIGDAAAASIVLLLLVTVLVTLLMRTIYRRGMVGA